MAENQKIWTAVDEYAAAALLPSDPVMDAVLENNRRDGLPAIDVSPLQGKFLELVVRMCGARRVLEIGTGSGYQTALLAHLASQVFSIERVAPLLERARDAIRQAGARNVSVLVGDGTLGWRDYGPYDAILVTAGAPEIPKPLGEQLSEGGRLLIPLGGREEQMLTLVTRRGESLERRDIGPARFVPLIGTFGWAG